MSDTTGLIQVKQLPIIEQRLRDLKTEIEKRTAEAKSLACTENTLQYVKQTRAELRKQFDELEAQRKAVKAAIQAPYNEFETVFKECVSDPYKAADNDLKAKIDDVEESIKQRCENNLRDYFDELCAAHGIDWLTYERAGIKVDMASAKQKTPKKLREQLVQFVVGVARDVETIDSLDDTEEILAEYKLTLNFPDAFRIVQDRHQRIYAEAKAKAVRQSAREAQSEAVRKVEALAPPTVETKQQNMTVTFTVTDTRERLVTLREWMKSNNYQFK